MAANVHTLAALSDFRSELCTFIVEARQALAALEMEARRAVEYITHDQAQAWQGELRRGREKVQQCKLEIHNTRTFKRIGNYTPSCIDEKKELGKAERRLQVAELKVEAVRHWGRVAEQAFREFQARLAQFVSLLDGELPKGVSALDRMLLSLESYLAVQAPAVALEAASQSSARATTYHDAPSDPNPGNQPQVMQDENTVIEPSPVPGVLEEIGGNQGRSEETR